MPLKPEDRVMIMAPIVRGRKGEFKKEMEKLAQHGFVRARIDGELRNLDEELDEIQLDKRKNHTIEVVVDRLLVKPGIEQRLEQSVAMAMKLGKGWCRWRWWVAKSSFIRRAGVSGLRHQRPAAGAALVFIQQRVWRLPGMPRAGQQI